MTHGPKDEDADAERWSAVHERPRGPRDEQQEDRIARARNKNGVRADRQMG